MYRLIFFAITLAFALRGHAAGFSQAGTSSGESKATGAQAGASFETAIVIHADNEEAGVKAEYAWIGKNIPGGRPSGQSLISHGGKMFDLIHVKLPDGTVRDVYFDITGFFGKG